MFRTRVSLQPFAANFSNDKKRFAKTEWLCRCKLEKESETHKIYGDSLVYWDICLKYDDLSDDEELTKFFLKIISRRDTLDQMDEEDM